MKNVRNVVAGSVAIVASAVFFLVPFAFIFVTASKSVSESSLLKFSWPQHFMLLDNLKQGLAANDYLMVIAFINSLILTVTSVAAMVLLAAMVQDDRGMLWVGTDRGVMRIRTRPYLP